VSHRPARKQNDCLNCGAVVYGRFCHICGQENVEPKESFWHLVTHFVYDVTHFDGKFFSTVKYLLVRPGFLPGEYMRGRRMRYLNPIKMYVFTSAFFFVFFFSFVRRDELIKVDKPDGAQVSDVLKDTGSAAGKTNQQLRIDSGTAILVDTLKRLNKEFVLIGADTVNLKDVNDYKKNIRTPFSSNKYPTVAAYDSAQQRLPPNERDSWVNRKLKIKKIQLLAKYGNDQSVILSAIGEKFLHLFPQLLFVSLPLFALLLGLLYVRRKQYYYADHIIYTIHLYCAMFIIIFLRIIIGMAASLSYLHWLKYARFLILLYCFWYIYKSMRNFYLQSRGKTILKFILLMFSSLFLLLLLFIVFGALSVFTV
jgi:hypothetical protein